MGFPVSLPSAAPGEVGKSATAAGLRAAWIFRCTLLIFRIPMYAYKWIGIHVAPPPTIIGGRVLVFVMGAFAEMIGGHEPHL